MGGKLYDENYAYYLKTGHDWGGNCYGMSSTAGLFFQNNSISASSFKSGASLISDLEVTSRNNSWNLTVGEFIEAMQISWSAADVSNAYRRNLNNLSSICAAVTAFQNSGTNPVVICVYPPKDSGHAVVGYRLDTSAKRLYVYDPNHPKDANRYITLTGNASSGFSGWSYDMGGYGTWTSANGGRITCIPYETFYKVWNNRGTPQVGVGNTPMSLLILDVDDAAILDSRNQVVASFENGVFTTTREDVYSVAPMGVPADGDSTFTTVSAVWLPTSLLYTVQNNETATDEYTATLINNEQAVSITTTAASVALSVDDTTSTTFAGIDEPGCAYSITLSAEDMVQDVELQGVSTDEIVSVKREGENLLYAGIDAGSNMPGAGAGQQTNAQGQLVARVFQDVSSGRYYTVPVTWAVEEGVTDGKTSFTFSPHETCTLAHILTFLWRTDHCQPLFRRKHDKLLRQGRDLGL